MESTLQSVYEEDPVHKKSEGQLCIYEKLADGYYIYLLLYVDDMLVASKNKQEIKSLEKLLSTEFEMKDLGAVKRILWMEISRDRSQFCLELSHSGYIEKVLKVFQMEQAKQVLTPLGVLFKLKSVTKDELEEQSEFMETIPYANDVGSIMYMMIGTRPDLAHSVGIISSFMAKEHWQTVKWVLRYIRGTSKSKIVFQKRKELKLVGYSDLDFATDLDKRRSMTGFVFTFVGT